MSQVVLKKILEYSLCFSMLQTKDPWDGAMSNPEIFIKTNLIEHYLSMLHTKFQTFVPMVLNKTFKNIFLCISMFQTKDLPGRAILDPQIFI